MFQKPPATLILSLALLAFYPLAHCAKEQQRNFSQMEKDFWKYRKELPQLAPLPKTKNGYTLKVRYVLDPQLPQFSPTQLKKAFAKTSQYTKKYLGYKVNFELVETVNIQDFFKANAHKFKTDPFAYLNTWYIDAKDPKVRAKSLAAIRLALKKHKPKVLFDYFGKPKGPYNAQAYAGQVTDVFLERMNGILNQKDKTGQPFYQQHRKLHISFAHWSMLAYQERDVDVIIYNSLMGGPDTGMPLYVINRGGITSAFVENNAHRPLQAVAIFPLYQFLSNGKHFKKVRGTWSRQQQVDIAAHMWVHELGHMLARKKENYTLNGSVHRAPTTLDYLSWMKGVKKSHLIIHGADGSLNEVGTLKKF